MKIKIVCVGNLKEKYLQEAQKEYEKRLSKFCDVEIIEIDEKSFLDSPQMILKEEAIKIEKKLSGYVIALDIGGKQISSEEFSRHLDDLKLEGVDSTITFLIGSSYGLSEEIKKKANEKISFSLMTFPHMLMRVILMEQVYRAFCISNNITYHK